MAASPVIIPTQSTPPTDDGSNLFCLPWYIAFDAMAQIINSQASSSGVITIYGVPVT